MQSKGAGPDGGRSRDGHFWGRWRGNFLTGLVLVAPVYLTYWIIASAVDLIDRKAAALLPEAWNPHTYLPIPGYGLVAFLAATALIGAIAKNFIAARVIRWTEQRLDSLPIVRSIYNGIKQIAETVLVQSKNSFEKACLVEYPRKGLWAVAFIASEPTGEVRARLGADEAVTVFMPTTPNPTTGFLFFARREEVIELDMSIEDAAKLIISAGLVMPPTAEERAAGRAAPRPALVAE
jgi:uncharacterized membrane protein